MKIDRFMPRFVLYTISALSVLVIIFSGSAASVFAIHGDVSLGGSNFEIDTDANLVVDHPSPSIDWASVDDTRKEDAPSGQNDDSFGQGTKEDTEVPVVVSGSIPPNKSDLKTFGVYKEENANGKFIHLFWTRVQDPSGTTNMDFEFNQSTTTSANGVTPERSPGDLLIVYELSKGGTVPELFLFTWLDGTEGLACEASNSFPCWGDRTDLDAAGAAAGSINTSPIADVDSDGLGPLDPRTFGEASIDLDFIFDANKCQSFGSAYLKSRSSDSFTAALKDFIAPQPVNLTNCGQVIIRKETNPEEDPNATSFGFTKTFGTDPATADTFSLTDDGVQTFNNVLLGTGYTVTEDSLPSGWELSGINCSASSGVSPFISGDTVTFGIDDTSDILDCTFTNQAKGTIIIEKVKNDDGFAQAFDFTSTALGPFSLTPTGTGEAGKDSTTFSDLVPGAYDVAESVPAGWNLVSASCDDGSDPSSIGLEAGETVTCTFTNERQRGAILVTKTRKHAADGPGDHAHAGVSFTVNGVTKATDANGQACFDGLLFGNYDVTETLPSGYVADGDLTKNVAVSAESSCGDGNEATVSFGNTPLTNVTVSVDSQVDGGTASTIVCTDAGGNVYNGSTGANGDGSLTVNNLLPTDPTVTLTCQITIDP